MFFFLELDLLGELAESLAVDGVGEDEGVLDDLVGLLVQGQHVVGLRGDSHIGGELREELLVLGLILSLRAELGEDGLGGGVGGGERSVVGNPLSQTSIDGAGVVAAELRR